MKRQANSGRLLTRSGNGLVRPETQPDKQAADQQQGPWSEPAKPGGFGNQFALEQQRKQAAEAPPPPSLGPFGQF